MADAYGVADGLRTDDLMVYGLGLAEAGHFRAAAYLVVKVDDRRPDPSLTGLAARLLLDAGDPGAARVALEGGAERHGWDSETRYLRCLAAARSNQLEDAVGFARPLVDDRDYGLETQLLLVDLLLKSGDVDNARGTADAILSKQPDSVGGLLARSRVARREGKTNEQMAMLERALQLNREDPAARTAHGIALLESGSREEGQRELAWVLARRPQDPAAVNALLGSSIRSHQGRLAYLAAFVAFPAVCVLIAWLVAAFQGKPASDWLTSVYFYSLFVAVIGARIFERLRTDRSVVAIRREAHRRVRRARPAMPTLRPLRWLLLALLASLWITFSIIATFFAREPDQSQVATFLLGLPAWPVLLLSVRLWRRRRRQLARGEPRSFDPASCQCHRVSKLSGSRAEAYAKRHLVLERPVDESGIELLRCGLLGTLWLGFSTESGIREEMLPVLFRFSEQFKPPSEPIEKTPTGFYL